MDKTSLGDRMKTYEQVPRRSLIKRMPVIIRVDGKAFHTLTANCKKPFDPKLLGIMWETALALCQNIQNARLAYIQSDEISILLNDYSTLDTQPWFDNCLDKIESVSAGIASAHFTNLWGSPAVFDSRAWNIPREEVVNYFIWRQQDCQRNSVSMVARAHFSHNELQKLNTTQMKQKLRKEADVNWDQLEVYLKRGACAIKTAYIENGQERTKWIIDDSIPVLTGERYYIDKWVE